MYIHFIQSQVSAEHLLPAYHVMCYLNEVNVPVQQLVQVSVGTTREGGHIGCKINNNKYVTYAL